MKYSNPERKRLSDVFDETLRAVHGEQDAASTKATTIRAMTLVSQLAQTFIVQTYRHNGGDVVFLEFIGPDESFRLALPPAVADCIARQRDALTTKNRKRAAKAEAARRKAQGIAPGFLKVQGEAAS